MTRGWHVGFTTNAVLIWYIQEKGLPLPSDDDMKAGVEYTAKQLKKNFFEVSVD